MVGVFPWLNGTRAGVLHCCACGRTMAGTWGHMVRGPGWAKWLCRECAQDTPAACRRMASLVEQRQVFYRPRETADTETWVLALHALAAELEGAAA